MERLTIFTPAYNRCELLKRCYASLQEQTNKNFVWTIVDDGSTDDTESTVLHWINENPSFKISYIKKKNGGLHTAYNSAIATLETELAICIDSDDFMPVDAVEIILNYWDEYGSQEYGGIIGLDFDPKGNVIGGYLPKQKTINLIDVSVGRYRGSWGDRKLVVRSELYKKVAPMKVFEGEKNFNPNYLHMEISRKYDFLILNKCLCVVDYQPTGMSSNIWKQYYNSPNSFGELRKQHLSFPNAPIKYTVKEYIHYISSCILAGKDLGLENRNRFIYSLAYPFGFILSRIIKHKGR